MVSQSNGELPCKYCPHRSPTLSRNIQAFMPVPPDMLKSPLDTTHPEHVLEVWMLPWSWSCQLITLLQADTHLHGCHMAGRCKTNTNKQTTMKYNIERSYQYNTEQKTQANKTPCDSISIKLKNRKITYGGCSQNNNYFYNAWERAIYGLYIMASAMVTPVRFNWLMCHDLYPFCTYIYKTSVKKTKFL